MNFLLTVKFHPRELARSLRLLPNSRGLFAEFLDCGGRCTGIMRAARFCYLSHASFGGLREHWAPEQRNGKPNHLHHLPARFYRWATRLARATLECAPWQEGSAEFVHFKLCGSWFGNHRKAAEFLRGETLRYTAPLRMTSEGVRMTIARE